MISNVKLLGLGPMGKNLALNMLDHDIPVTGFDISQEARDNAAQAGIPVACSLEELVGSEKEQKAYWLMVPDSKVDGALKSLFPYLQRHDVLIDGGNSYFQDTERRSKEIAGLSRGIGFLGIGVSGGVEGARNDPCFMVGGDDVAYGVVEEILTTLAAKIDNEPAVSYFGTGGAGHFIKMVHNGIEYGMMQAIGEAYLCLHKGLGLSQGEVRKRFKSWSEGHPLSSYLLETAVKVMAAQDGKTNEPLLSLVKDVASQKGTGKWIVQTASELGVPIPTISAAVEARLIAADRKQRGEISEVTRHSLNKRGSSFSQRRYEYANTRKIKDALYHAFFTSYAQGFHLLAVASPVYDYELSLSGTAYLWRGGSIIRSALLEGIQETFAHYEFRIPYPPKNLSNLLADSCIHSSLDPKTTSLRHILRETVSLGLPTPVFSQSLAYYDSYRQQRLESASLVALLRDCFGAHTYQRTDAPGSFHTLWTGDGTEVKVNTGG